MDDGLTTVRVRIILIQGAALCSSICGCDAAGASGDGGSNGSNILPVCLLDGEIAVTFFSSFISFFVIASSF